MTSGSCRSVNWPARCAIGPERSRTRVIETASIHVEASRTDPERLSLLLPGAEAPGAPTHWSFGQLAAQVSAPAAYLRQLPASLAGINLQYGLTSNRAEQVKTLETEDGRVELRAVTGPDYGRIYDHELIEAMQRIAGNGTGDTRWKVPGVLDWSTGLYNPRVDMSKDTTTLYASDRGMFLFLVTAGGPIMRDLFQSDDGGWLRDVPLLERLVAEKLARDAGPIRAEGWKWVETAIDFPYGHTYGLRHLQGERQPLSEEEAAARESLRLEVNQLEAAYSDADEIPEEVDARLAEIETALEAMEDRPVIFARNDIVHAGVFVSIDGSGRLRVERGYVRQRQSGRSLERISPGSDARPKADAFEAFAGKESSVPASRRAHNALPFTASAIDAAAAGFKSTLFPKAARAPALRFLRRTE